MYKVRVLLPIIIIILTFFGRTFMFSNNKENVETATVTCLFCHETIIYIYIHHTAKILAVLQK